MPKRLTALIHTTTLLLVSVGCSSYMGNGLAYTPKKARPETIRQQVVDIADQIRQWADLPQGKLVPPSASIDLDAKGVKRGYTMTGGFSIYGLTEGKPREGYDRLRKALPGYRWKIIKDGIDHQVSGSPTVEAEHQTDDHCSLILDLLPARNGDPAVLAATIGTPIYVAPEGVDLTRYS